MPSVHFSSNTKLSRNVSGTLLNFCFDQQGIRRGVSTTIKKVKVFEFFVDCSVIDVKLVFLPRYSVVSDTLIGVYI